MMNFYYVNPKQSYLESIAKYINNNFDDYSNVIVILNDYFSSSFLQNKLISLSNNNHTLLPEFPSSIENSSLDYLFKSDLSSKSLTHQLLMTEIISNYKGAHYKFSQALQISSDIIDILNQIEAKNISLDNINKWVEEDLAEHWWQTADFLNYCFSSFKATLKKQDFTSENPQVNKIVHNKKIILAGFFDIPNSLKTKEEFLDIDFILPPVTYSDFHILQKSKNLNDNFIKSYALDNIVSDNIELNIKELIRCDEGDLTNFSSKEVSLIELDNIYEEAKLCAKLAIKSIKEDKTIAIISYNKTLLNIIENYLSANSYNYNSSTRKNILSTSEGELIFKLAEFKNSKGSIKSFYYLLSSKILQLSSIYNELQVFIELLEKSEQFFYNIEDISVFYSKLDNQNNSIACLLKLLIEWVNFSNTNLKELIEHNIMIAEKLYSDIWIGEPEPYSALDKSNLYAIKEHEKNKIKELLRDLITEDGINKEIDINDYSKIIAEFLKKSFKSKFNNEAKIFLIDPLFAYCQNFDEIIIADFNYDSWLLLPSEDPWLGDKIKRKLNLATDEGRYKQTEYLIEMFVLNGSNVLFTRSLFYKGTQQLICPLIDNLNIKSTKIDELVTLSDFSEENIDNIIKVKINFDMLPKNLSATNIDLLIRNPYGFFAKNVLHLKKSENLTDSTKTKEFGIIAHNMISKLSLQKEIDIDKELVDELDAFNIQKADREIFINAIKSFLTIILYNQKNFLSTGGEVYSEINGTLPISLTNCNITISAKADKIEVDHVNGQINIIDYKTGTVPTAFLVKKGIAPQLILEAIILKYRGYEKIHYPAYKILLCYVKLTSTYPYFEETFIKLSDEDIENHYNGLVRLLNYYYQTGEFQFTKMPDWIAASYNDYEYLSRFKDL